MNSLVKNLLEILIQGGRHGFQAMVRRIESVWVARKPRATVPAAEDRAVAATAPPMGDTKEGAVLGCRSQKLKSIGAGLVLVLALMLAVVWMLRHGPEQAGAAEVPAPSSWILRYRVANEAFFSSGSVPSLDALAAGAAGNPLRQLLMDGLRARLNYEQTLQTDALRLAPVPDLDWASQDPETLQAYAESLLDNIDLALNSGLFEAAVVQTQALAHTSGVFSGNQPTGRDLALKLVTGRAMLAAGRIPTESWIKPIRDLVASAPEELSLALRLDATLLLAQFDLMEGHYGLARERLARVTAAMDQGLLGAHAFRVDLLEMRLATLALQAGMFEVPRNRLEPLVVKAATATRCHVYLDALMAWADIAVQQAQYVKAEQAYQQAQACLDSKGRQAHFQSGQLQNGLGVLLTHLGRREDALRALAVAESIWRPALPRQHAWMGSLHNNLGALHRSKGDFEAARTDYETAAAIWSQALGEHHPVMATYHNNVAELDMLMARLDGVNASLLLSLEMRREAFGDEHPWTALVVSNLGEYLALIGQPVQALEQHEKALKVRELTLGGAHPDTAMSLNNMGAILFGNQEFWQSLEKFEQALAINKVAYGEAHPRTLLPMTHLATNQMALGDFGAAESLLLQVVEGLRAIEPASPMLHSALVKLGEAQLFLGKPEEAGKHYISALELADQGDRRAMLSGSIVAYKALLGMYSQRKNTQAVRQFERRFAWAKP